MISVPIRDCSVGGNAATSASSSTCRSWATTAGSSSSNCCTQPTPAQSLPGQRGGHRGPDLATPPKGASGVALRWCSANPCPARHRDEQGGQDEGRGGAGLARRRGRRPIHGEVLSVSAARSNTPLSARFPREPHPGTGLASVAGIVRWSSHPPYPTCTHDSDVDGRRYDERSAGRW